MHTLGGSNQGLLGPGAGGVSLGPGHFPRTVQKMWRGLDPSVSRDSHCAQPEQQAGSSTQLEASCLLYIFRSQTPNTRILV